MGKKKNTSLNKPAQGSAEQTVKEKPKETKKQRHTKLYREYSRRKYEVYKSKFPRLKEYELVEKILKQWQAFTEEEKQKLQEKFKQIGSPDLQDGSKSKSNSKSKSKSKSGSDSVVKPKEQQVKQQDEDGKKPKKKKKPSPKVRVFIEKATDANRNYMEDSDFNKDEKEKPLPSDDQSIQLKIKGEKKIGKTKGIVKSTTQQKQKRQTEYHKFFKYYYNRLAGEHPRWTAAQVKSIIRLLWRKRSKIPKKRIPQIKKRTKSLSGRVMYRIEKQAQGWTKEQIKTQWRLLPFESKKHWEIKGRVEEPNIDQSLASHSQLKKIMKSGADPNAQRNNNLKWMDSLIRVKFT